MLPTFDCWILFQPVHLDYIVAAANLRAAIYGLEQCRDSAAIAKMVAMVPVPEFTPRSGVHIDVTDAEAQARTNDSNVGEWQRWTPTSCFVFIRMCRYRRCFLGVFCWSRNLEIFYCSQVFRTQCVYYGWNEMLCVVLCLHTNWNKWHAFSVHGVN